MRALLVSPPALHMIKTNVPGYVNEGVGIFPPIGLLYIASYAREHTDFKIRILDCKALNMNYDMIENSIREFDPDVVGIEAYTFTLIDSIKTAETVKKINKDIHLCMGGPHVDLFPEETINIPYVDSVIRREGEHIFADLLNAIKKKKNLTSVKGLLFKKNGKKVNTGIRPFLTSKQLDMLPHPARDLIPINKYYSIITKQKPITTIMTSRGCPFQCIFCQRSQMGEKFRFRSVDNIIEEIEICIDMGIREVFFYDDTFTFNQKRVFDLCDKLIEKKLNKKIV